ncbi:excalibur calcium-binding domain-containing protein [Peribacillus sp. FSL H8-0477]|uniref:excalibur calcium-binding domain-containing protein n=1 Tax=Peribacillus sp. FSL H8-0477 TaxID=2921388 RepID=UPI0030F5AB0F
MKKITMVVLSLSLVLGFSFSTLDVAEAKGEVKKFSNCKAMNKVYKGGVAKTKNTKNKGGKTKIKPYVSKALYNANKTKDRDKDNIACER